MKRMKFSKRPVTPNRKRLNKPPGTQGQRQAATKSPFRVLAFFSFLSVGLEGVGFLLELESGIFHPRGHLPLQGLP